MTEQANSEAKARVFKSREADLRLVVDGVDVQFHKRRLVTSDPEMIALLEKLVKDKPLGIRIDPNEVETSVLPPASDAELRRQQILEFRAKQNTFIDAGNSKPTPLRVATSADSPTTGGRNSGSTRFTKEELLAALGSSAAKTVTPVELQSNSAGATVPETAPTKVAETTVSKEVKTSK